MLFSVTAFAEEPSVPNEQSSNYESDTAESEQKEENTFQEIYGIFSRNSDKIFSLLAFSVSLILVFIYKRGLIPIVNTALSAIRKNTEGLEAVSKESLVSTEKSIELLTERFISVMNTVESLSGSVESLNESFDYIKDEKNDVNTLRTVMLSQVDLLYEIFMNSALPQYSKEVLGEKIANMKKQIRVGEDNV